MSSTAQGKNVGWHGRPDRSSLRLAIAEHFDQLTDQGLSRAPGGRGPRGQRGTGLWLALFGAFMIVGGIAAHIEAGRHRPQDLGGPGYLLERVVGWPATTYDLVRIGAWALVVLGAVIVAFALVREIRRPA